MMKHLKKIAISLLLCCIVIPMQAQPNVQPLPIDPKVRYGKLENGLTYYIRQNALPKNMAEFYIVQNVGSMQEEDNQRGLAHFLEHMAFNGTKNFPGKSMLNYLETNGVKFGTNVNAYTSFDETVYNLSSVPTTRQGMVDSCLLVLHDWSGFISLEDKEIDSERGVIREEWRTRNNAQSRTWDILIPQMFPNSKYSNRMPIGDIEIINTFPYSTIRDYYKKWYRPDLQSIVVVGDIDVDYIENKIKQMFADIPKPVNAAERVSYPVPDVDETIVAIATDKESTSTAVGIYYKQDILPKKLKQSAIYYQQSYMNSMLTSMLNSRFSEITQKANPPFLGAASNYSEYFITKTKDAFAVFASAKEGGSEDAFKALVKEIERVKQFGFTPSEYARAKANYLKSLEISYNERDKVKSKDYVKEYVENFTNNVPFPGIETDYLLMNEIAKNVKIDMINQYAKEIISDKNMVVSINGPEKQGLVYPDRAALLNDYQAVKAEKVEPYKDTVSDKPLMAKEPNPGKVIKEVQDEKFGTTIWTLSNGAKVVLKPTEFKKDQILMKAISQGGSSVWGATLPKDENINVKLMNSVISVGGVGEFSNNDLEKVLAGKSVSVNSSVNTYSESLSGNTNPNDLETMLQLTYLTVTAPRMDQDAYASWLSRMKAQMKNVEANPNTEYSDSIISVLFKNNPRRLRLKLEDLDQVNYAKIVDLYKDRFKNMGDFTFTFVGNIDKAKMKPLVEKYIASLPSTKKQETYKDINLDVTKGVHINHFDKKMQTPKTSVFGMYTGKTTYNLENIVKSSMMEQIMRIVFTETIREQEGGTYGVSSNSNIEAIPTAKLSFSFEFDTDPKLKDKLIAKAKEEFNKLATDGPSLETFNKVKEYMLKNYKENQMENNYWLAKIDSYNMYKVDTMNGYEDIVKKMTPNDIKVFAKSLIDQGNYSEVVMSSAAN